MKNHRRQTEQGISLVMTAIMLIPIVPMISLSLDATLLYVDKTRLQAAVDGAALAGARALSRGTNDTAQISAAGNAAAEYVLLNYPSSFFFTNSVVIDHVANDNGSTSDIYINETVANQRTVNVTAHAIVPTLFPIVNNATATRIVATAAVTRRDVNVSMAVDRSGSLAASGSCGAVQQAAINFTNKFANGTDNVGLVTFGSTTHVDFAIANNFQTASPNIVTEIDNIQCQNSTSTAMALWYAYDQLVGLNQPGALNVILLFTDGKPTGVDVAMPVASSSSCRVGNTAVLPATITGLYNTFTSSNQFFGVLAPTYTGTTVPTNDFAMTTDANAAKCAFAQNWNVPSTNTGPNDTNTSDFKGVPTTDVFGSNLANGYLPVTLSGSYIDLGNSTNAGNMPQNAADDAASKIRAGANESGPLTHAGHGLSDVIIYTVGLGNAPYPLSVPLLERISNDPRASNYNSNQAAGLFELAPTTADINSAFAAIASQILRLAR